jgi:hypothetical protein
MKQLIFLLGVVLLASTVLAQSYTNSQNRATGRHEQSWFDISRELGKGEDWLTYPTVDLSFNTQFQNDYQDFRSGGSSNNLVNTSDLSTTLWFAPRLAIYSDITLDQINGPDPGEDSWFEQEGIFSSNLFLQYSNEIITFGGGQFTPNFGIANALAPGIYGGDYVGDYSFDDQIGLFGAIDLGRELIGRHVFSGSVFMVDTTFLSDSTITKRGQTSLSDGGPGNTEDLSSFALQYNGIDVPIFDMPILQYDVGFISQAKGEGDEERQYGGVAGLALTIPLDGDPWRTASNQYQAIQPLVEYARFENWTGADDATADYLTIGIEYFYGDWDFNVSATLRDTDGITNEDDENDYLIQATVSYQLYGYQALEGNGQIGIAYSYRRDGGEYSNMVGVQLSLGWDLLNRFQLTKGW